MLPSESPLEFCKAYIERSLVEYKQANMYVSYWQTIESLVSRSNELSIVFEELIDRYGYSDIVDGYSRNGECILLILDHIWGSYDFRKDKIDEARVSHKELKEIQEEIKEGAKNLAENIRKQKDLLDSSGFESSSYQTTIHLLEQAGETNNLFKSYVLPNLKCLVSQYDLRYWPKRADLVEAIGLHEITNELSFHWILPEEVIDGRKSDFKDFIITFDAAFVATNSLPNDFKFSNKAMAEIINVILDLPPDKIATADAVKTVRNRYKIES